MDNFPPPPKVRHCSVEPDVFVRSALDKMHQDMLTQYLTVRLSVVKNTKEPSKWLSEEELYRRSSTVFTPFMSPTPSDEGGWDSRVVSPSHAVFSPATTSFSRASTIQSSVGSLSPSSSTHSQSSIDGDDAFAPKIVARGRKLDSRSGHYRITKRSNNKQRSTSENIHSMQTRSKERVLRSRTRRLSYIGTRSRDGHCLKS
jgi:hypothetical protein